jgi:hypothetical protein
MSNAQLRMHFKCTTSQLFDASNFCFASHNACFGPKTNTPGLKVEIRHSSGRSSAQDSPQLLRLDSPHIRRPKSEPKTLKK